MATADGVQWPDLCFPPINLWVMPGWQAEGSAPSRNTHTQQPHQIMQLLQLHKQLLATRGGIHGNQD